MATKVRRPPLRAAAGETGAQAVPFHQERMSRESTPDCPMLTLLKVLTVETAASK